MNFYNPLSSTGRVYHDRSMRLRQNKLDSSKVNKTNSSKVKKKSLVTREIERSSKPTISRSKQALALLHVAGSEFYEFFGKMAKGFVDLFSRLVELSFEILNKKEFSKEFNKDLLGWYKPQGTVEKNIVQFRKDVERLMIYVEDENGRRPLVDEKDPYPKFGDIEKQAMQKQLQQDGVDDAEILEILKKTNDHNEIFQDEWINRQEKAMLEFFNNDQNAFEKGIQYISQTMGNMYVAAALTSENSPQKLENGNRFQPALDRNAGAIVLKNYLVVKRKEGRLKSVEYVNDTKPLNILEAKKDGGDQVECDQEKSRWSVSVRLYFDEDTNPISCEGDVAFNIVAKEDTND